VGFREGDIVFEKVGGVRGGVSRVRVVGLAGEDGDGGRGYLVGTEVGGYVC
jgi:hypothetical protein